MPERTDRANLIIVGVACFLAGVAVSVAVLMPDVATPDYQRGHDDGFQAGFEQNSKKLSEVSFENTQLRAELKRLK